jgi:hypothetical protein
MQRMKEIVACGLVLTSVSAYGQDKSPTYYDLSSDPSSSMTLLGLDSIDGQGANTTFIVVDLFRGGVKTGMINTWKANCTNGTMRIIKGMAFSPGTPSKAVSLKSEIVKASATPISRTMYRLVCTGEGDLQAARTYHDELPNIIKTFWR